MLIRANSRQNHKDQGVRPNLLEEDCEDKLKQLNAGEVPQDVIRWVEERNQKISFSEYAVILKSEIHEYEDCIKEVKNDGLALDSLIKSAMRGITSIIIMAITMKRTPTTTMGYTIA